MYRLVLFFLFSIQYAFAFRPLVLNYSYNDYQGHQTNYDAVFTNDGLLYVANAYGLLEFDGISWNKIALPMSKSPLSLSLSSKGELFVGAHEDIGYIKSDSSGKKIYHSLRHLVPTEKIGRANFTLCYEDKTYFVTYEKIYVYDGKTINIINSEKGNFFFFIGATKGEVIVMESNKGLGKIENNKIQWFNAPGFEWHEVRGIEKKAENEYLIFRQWDVVLMKNGVVEQVKSLEKLFGLDISDVCFSTSSYVLSTQGSGVFYVDKNLHLTDSYSEADGIGNAYINAIAVNNKNDICLASLNGISLLRQNKEKIFYDKKQGISGLGYSSALFNDTLFVGTSQGLFYLPKWSTNKNGSFVKCEGTKNFVYDIYIHQGHLFCGDQSDVYEVVKAKAQKISPVSWQGSWKFSRIPNRNDVFMVGTYHGIDIYRLVNGRWTYSNKLKGFDESARQFEMDQSGRIWVSQGINGMFCLEINNDFTKVVKIRDICKELKVGRDYFNDVVALGNELKISSFGGMYQVEEGDIKKDNSFSKLSKDPVYIRSINGKLIYSVENGHPQVLTYKNGYFEVDKSHQLNNISLDLIGSAEHINNLEGSYYLAAGPDGAVLSLPFNQNNFSGKVNIRSLECMGDSILSYYNINSIKTYTLPFTNNSLRFYFASSPFEKSEEVCWYYKLEKKGEKADWIKLGSTNYKELIGLAAGKYTFSIKALSYNIELGSASCSFIVLPPWYANTWAFVVYFLLIVMLCFAVWFYTKKKLERSEQELTLQKEEELKLQNEKFEKEKLQLLLQEKETALSGLAANYAQKKEYITQVKNDVERLIEEINNEALQDKLKHLKVSLEMSDEDQANWENFQGHANQEYNNLFEKIKKLDPNINESNLLLCSYIRAGKSNKEMSNLLSVSPSTIDKRKSRLRQKFNIPENQTLMEFIRSL